MDAWIATIVNFAAETSLFEVVATTTCALLLVVIASLTTEYFRVKKAHAAAKAQLVERSVDKHSTNWADTAQNLERKAVQPGAVARSSALTHLHILDEAANAWLKGSEWPKALSVTQDLLHECCHTAGKPSLDESEFRATSDIIERRLATYPDLARAASQATENTLKFLSMIDLTLSVVSNSARVAQLREHIATARAAIDTKPVEEKAKVA